MLARNHRLRYLSTALEHVATSRPIFPGFLRRRADVRLRHRPAAVSLFLLLMRCLMFNPGASNTMKI